MTPCIESTLKTRSSGGYARKKVKGKRRSHHRLVYAEAHGLDEATMGGAVMHLCDNPPCINPDHLRLGTKALNTQDMAEKNRSGLAKLTIEQVQYIRSHTLKGRGGNVRSMAEKFGVQIQQIHRILSGVRRQWITF